MPSAGWGGGLKRAICRTPIGDRPVGETTRRAGPTKAKRRRPDPRRSVSLVAAISGPVEIGLQEVDFRGFGPGGKRRQ